MSEDCESSSSKTYDLLGGDGKVTNGLMLFYMALSGNFIGELLSKQMQELFNNNRIAKHLIGFIIMLFTITYSLEIAGLFKSLMFTGFLYLIFLLTSKMPLTWNLAIVGLLVISFVIDKYKTTLDEDDDEDTIEWLNVINRFLYVVILGGTLAGSAITIMGKGGLTGAIPYIIGEN